MRGIGLRQAAKNPSRRAFASTMHVLIGEFVSVRTCKILVEAEQERKPCCVTKKLT